jgi:hypothetical protein
MMQIRHQSLRTPPWRIKSARSILARLASFFLIARLDERLMDVFDPMLMRSPIAGETNPMASHRNAAVMVAVWTSARSPDESRDLELAGACCLDAEEDVDDTADKKS